MEHCKLKKLPQKFQNYYLLVICSQITQVSGSVPMNEEMPKMPLATDSSMHTLVSVLKWGSDFLKLWFGSRSTSTSRPCKSTGVFLYHFLISEASGKHQDQLKVVNSGGEWTIQECMCSSRLQQQGINEPLCLRSICKIAYTCDPCQYFPLDSCQLSNSNCLQEFLALMKEGESLPKQQSNKQ